MDRRTEWRHRIDHLLTSVSGQLKTDLYDNVVVPVVQDWFASGDSITQLNKNIEQRLSEAWLLSERNPRHGH